MNQNVTIIGAGMAGCFMAICLAKRGYQVDVYDRLSKKELTQEASTRSFNLTFYERGTQIFKKAGMWDVIEPILRVSEGSNAHSSHGTNYTPYNTKVKPRYVVERPDLLRMVLEEALKYPNVRFHFDTSLVSIDKINRKITLLNERTGNFKTVSCDAVFGADGVNSRVRSFIQQGQDTTHTQEFHSWTYKQIKITADEAKKMGWKSRTENFVHAKNALIIALSNTDGTFTGIFLLPQNTPGSFANLTDEQTVLKFLQKTYPMLETAYPTLTQCILKNPEGRLTTVMTDPWFAEDFMVMIGDSAHGVLPFYGQGVSAAFEDCIIMSELIDEHKGDWGKIFPLYQSKRKPNTDLLAELSKESFDRLSRYREIEIVPIKNRLDLIMHKLFPRFWLPPIYEMIATDASEFQDIIAKHEKRQMVARWLGISAAAYIIYAGLTIKKIIYKKL